jgi:hypothetical protein
MSWIRRTTHIFSYLMFLFLTVALLLEVIFRFLPVSTSGYIQTVNEISPISHFQKNIQVSIQKSAKFEKRIFKKTNNYGYFSDYNYSAKRKIGKCRSVVIGDSYVQAEQVKNSESFHAILNEGSCETFAIGKSGDPLSQYVAYTDFAVKEFNPDFVIISVIDNDYDESFLKYKSAPAAHYFDQYGKMKRVDFTPSLLGKVLRSSRFLYYLYRDVKIFRLYSDFLKGVTGTRSLDRDINLDDRLKTREEDAKKAASIFLKYIGEMSSKTRFLLVIDGNRKQIYQGAKERNTSLPIDAIHGHLITEAQQYPNIKTLDLQTSFYEDWVKNKILFNTEEDYHWNSYGHSLVADAIETFLFESGNFCNDCASRNF